MRLPLTGGLEVSLTDSYDPKALQRFVNRSYRPLAYQAGQFENQCMATQVAKQRVRLLDTERKQSSDVEIMVFRFQMARRSGV